MDIMEQQHIQLYHHEEAQQQKPDALNFRHMLCNHGNPAKSKTITKADSSWMGRNPNPDTQMLSNNNKLHENDSNHKL